MNLKKLLLILIISCIGISLFSQELKIGDKLPLVVSTEITGDKCVPIKLNELTRNKIVIIEFWETWCGPCIWSMPHLKQLYDKFKGEVIVIAVCHSDLEKSIAFIKENGYPFRFLFEKEKELSKLFPHNGIPHTILIDRQGVINNITYPSYITEEVISKLIDGKNTNLPQTGKITSIAKEDAEMPLFSFKISRYKLGENHGYCESAQKTRQFQYVFGYEANMFKDSVETSDVRSFIGMNIRQLYQMAYGNMNEYRIIFPEELKRIGSNMPQHLYNLSFSISNWLGDINTTLHNQLDIAFNLHSCIKKCDTTVLILKEIIPNDSIFRLLSPIESDTIKTISSTSAYSDYKITIKSNKISEQGIAKTLEDYLKLPVIGNENKLYYQANLKKDPDEKWIKLSIDENMEMLRKYGIILEKQLRKVDYVQIEK